MSNYEHLPVFKASYELLLESYRVTKNFPKEYKYTVGEAIKTLSLDLILLIYTANSTVDSLDRGEYIVQSIGIGEKLKILYRISKDIKIMPLKNYITISTQNVEILRQLEGWKKTIQKTANA